MNVGRKGDLHCPVVGGFPEVFPPLEAIVAGTLRRRGGLPDVGARRVAVPLRREELQRIVDDTASRLEALGAHGSRRTD
jgi:hypothetical protein